MIKLDENENSNETITSIVENESNTSLLSIEVPINFHTDLTSLNKFIQAHIVQPSELKSSDLTPRKVVFKSACLDNVDKSPLNVKKNRRTRMKYNDAQVRIFMHLDKDLFKHTWIILDKSFGRGVSILTLPGRK